MSTGTLAVDFAAVGRRIGLDEAGVARALQLHRDSIVIDGSAVCFRKNLSAPVSYDRYTVGGVTATNNTVTMPAAGLERALDEVNWCRRWIDANPDKVKLVLTVDDIHAAHREGLGGIILGPQDTAFIGHDLSLIGTFYDLGIRVLQLTYQSRNSVGDGCGEPFPGRLSRFGVDAVREMNRLGIVVDVSHTSEESSLHAVEVSEKPVILSHANPAALTKSIRTKSDGMIKAIAESGGVIGLTCLSAFVRLRPGRPTLLDWIEHVKYLVDLVGEDHVAIGLDLAEAMTEEDQKAGRRRYPEFATLDNDLPWEDNEVEDLTVPAEIPNVTLALVAGGFTDDQIRKILGLNFLRAFGEVWRA